MKSLTILIYSLLAVSIFKPVDSRAQILSVKTGLYDFTENTASEFYILAPILLAECKIWKSSQVDLRMSPGFSFNRTRYNSHYHYLYMIPLLTTVYYHLPNPDSKVFPSIGAGFSLLGKADHNQDFNITHYALAYGFHFTGRLNFFLKKDWLFFMDMTYNLLIPTVREEVNLSGIILTAGFNIPENKSRRQASRP